MQAGDVVLMSLRQADGQDKVRPALLLCQLPPFDDWLACGISSQVRHHVDGFDEIIRSADPDFSDSGLRGDSLIRLGFLGALPEAEIAGSLGRIAEPRLLRLRSNLVRHLNAAVGNA